MKIKIVILALLQNIYMFLVNQTIDHSYRNFLSDLQHLTSLPATK